MSYMYYLPIAEYAEAFISDNPIRVYGEPAPADWPDALRVDGDTSWIRDWIS